MGPQYVNVCEVNHSSGSTYVTNWGFPEADQFVHRAAFAVTPFLGDITPFSKPGRRFGNYVPSLGRSFTVVNIVGSRPAFRVSSLVIRSVFTNGLSIQT